MGRRLRAALGFAMAAAVTIGVAPTQADDQEFDSAAALLEALENADHDLNTFQATIVYDKLFMLQDDRHVRFGKLYFASHPAPQGVRPTRTFAVHFETLILDDRQSEDRQAWIFDGEWLIERRESEKQYVARQIARPGQNLDPLRLGEGPLPIPIGQRKDDILARYTAELRAWDDGFDPEDPSHIKYMEHLGGATQIELAPHPHRLDEDDFRSIRLWYRRNSKGRMLPVLARTRDRKGDETFVQLVGTRVNADLPEGVIDIEPPKDPAWHVQIEEWRGDHEIGGVESEAQVVDPEGEAK